MDLHRVDGVNGADEHQVTLYEYDGRNLVTKEVNAAGGNTLYVYDGNGNIISKTDADGYVTEYTYNSLDLVSHISYNGAKEVSYQYNKVGELVKIDDWLGTTTFELDLLSQLKKVTDHKGNVVEYTYDEVGNQTNLTYPDKTTVSKSYDAEGNLITEYQRDSDGEAGLVANTTYTYDALNRLTGSKKVVERTRKTYAKTYAYDSLGNLVQENGPDSRDQTTYQYNSLNQMVARKECGYVQSITRIHDYGYTYDGRGNLIKEEEICSPTTQGPKNITIATYTYDETNKMVSGTNKDGEVSNYTFNGLGVRVGTEVIVKDNTHGYTDFHCQTPTVETGIDKPEVVLSDYVIDYTRLNIDQRVLVESETDGYDFRYTYGLDLVNVKATGEGTSWWAQSVKKCVYSDYVHTDRLGSVVNLTDQYGRVPAQIDYDDWGKITAYQSLNISSGYRTVLPEITYAGHQYDDVLGMYYAKARFYDPDTKRFVAMDPIKGNITEPLSLVPYVYCVDNPLRWVDPTGEAATATATAYITFQNVIYPLLASAAKIILAGVVVKVAHYGICVIQGETAYYSPNHLWDSVPGTTNVPLASIAAEGPIYEIILEVPEKTKLACEELKKAGSDMITDKQDSAAGGATGGPRKDDDDDEKRPATTEEWTKAAERLGYRKTNYKSHGKPVYTNGKNYITPDVDSHNGGWWKMAKKPEDLLSRQSRMGTYDSKLNRIGG